MECRIELIVLAVFLFFLLIFLIYKIISNVKYKVPHIIVYLKQKLAVIDPRILTFDIRENSSESYTIDKNTMYICTKDPRTGEYYSDNTLVYVIIHEWAHVLDQNHDPDHNGDSFRNTFNNLLTKAKTLGLYDDRIPLPKTYCSV